VHELRQLLQLVGLHDLLRQVVLLQLLDLALLAFNQLLGLLDVEIESVSLLVVLQFDGGALLALRLLCFAVEDLDVVQEAAYFLLDVLLPQGEVHHAALDAEYPGFDHFTALKDFLEGLWLLLDKILAATEEILVGDVLGSEGLVGCCNVRP